MICNLFVQCLDVLSFLYSKSELATTLKDCIESDQSCIIDQLVLIYENNLNHSLIGKVIAKIVLSLDNENLLERLHNLSDSLVSYLICLCKIALTFKLYLRFHVQY